MREEQLLERITLNPKVMVGKPVIRGTRLTVEYILNLLAHGATVAEILEEYQGLTPKDIQACLLFAAKSLANTTFLPLSVAEDKAIEHLERIRQDIRDEIKRRIEQRDKYSIQLTIALGAIIAISLPPDGFKGALIAAPLVSIYFTMLILYSYRIHRILSSYLRNEIEPELARLCGVSPQKEWEIYYESKAVPGLRKNFFMLALWVVCVLSLTYLWFTQRDQFGCVVLAVATVIYSAATIAITVAFWR